LGGCRTLIVNEIEYLAWEGFGKNGLASLPVYLDLHEDHVNDAHRGPLEAVAFKKYWDWQLSQFVSFVRSRNSAIELTCVEKEIAQSYERLVDRPVALIFNAPDNNDLSPTNVNPEQIKLIHHGMGTKGRGIETAIKALADIPKNYTLDLVLFATRLYKLKIKLLSLIFGVRRRVKLEDGIPLDQLPTRLNLADISIVVLSNVTDGHLNSLPNKFFESIHSKLALITGPNPSMASMTKEFGMGVVLETWSSKDLARALMSLSPIEIQRYKANAVLASRQLSSVQSKETFDAILDRLHPRRPIKPTE